MDFKEVKKDQMKLREKVWDDGVNWKVKGETQESTPSISKGFRYGVGLGGWGYTPYTHSEKVLHR